MSILFDLPSQSGATFAGERRFSKSRGLSGGGHPDPEIIGGVLQNFFFDFSGLSLVQKPNLKPVNRSYRFSNNTKQWKKTEPP